MIGMVLAAGAGRRLRPLTDALPKALLPVDGDVTILDIALRNLAAVGLRDIVIVIGYPADVVRSRVPALERAHGVRLTLVDNDRAEEWNNAYSSGWPAPTSPRACSWSTETPCTRSRSSKPSSPPAPLKPRWPGRRDSRGR